MQKISKVFWLTLIVAICSFMIGSADLFAVNSVRLQCPITKPVVDGDSIPINIYITNDVQLSAFSIGFHWDKTAVPITSAKKGADFPVGANFQKGFRPADQLILIGMISFDPSHRAGAIC